MNDRQYRNSIKKQGKQKTHESMMVRKTDFPEWLRNEIINLGISQRELAYQLEIDESIISRWCNGSRFPTVNQVISIAQYMGISTDIIMDKK